MEMYLADARFYGTQVDAKKASKEFEKFDFPKRKHDIIDFLNTLVNIAEQRGREQLPEDATPADNHFDQAAAAGAFSIDDLQDLFEAAPLSLQLQLAAVANENARALEAYTKPPLDVSVSEALPDGRIILIDSDGSLYVQESGPVTDTYDAPLQPPAEAEAGEEPEGEEEPAPVDANDFI